MLDWLCCAVVISVSSPRFVASAAQLLIRKSRTPQPTRKMEPKLTAVGPSASAADNEKVGRRPTEAWRDDQPKAGDVGVGSSSGSAVRLDSRSTWRRRTALAIVCLQALWAVAIPLKNVATTVYPTTRPDAATLSTLPYTFNSSASDLTSEFPGRELPQLLRDVARIALTDPHVRAELESVGALDVDRIYKLVSLDELAVLAPFYALGLQSATFPAAAFTPRSFAPQEEAQADETDGLTLLLRDSTTTAADPRDIDIQLACSSDRAFLTASRCTQQLNGDPCPAQFESQDDAEVVRVYEGVDLRTIGTNSSGLANNIGLLYLVDYFQQAMTALLTARDWSTALSNLGFSQDVEVALTAGSASAVKNGTGAPYLLDTHAFIVGVRAALLETSRLDSCVASELVVAFFYSRAFVLRAIEDVLIDLDALYDVAAGPSVVLPNNTEAVLEPMLQFNVTLSSGARAGPRTRRETVFLAHVHVATRTSVAVQFKFDRSVSSPTQIAGSSLRMVQQLTFYPELLSVFHYDVASTTATSSAAAFDYDVQTFKLLGAGGAALDTFQEAMDGAGTAVVFPLYELEATEAQDSWWDDEALYAGWFRDLEAETRAPMRLFDTYLNIQSVAVTDTSEDDDRCRRALFKVVAKIVYLALVAASKPASYLMFMGDVAAGHRAWLLSAVYNDALVGETLFGADRIGLTYRQTTQSRKADGSAWVVLPLLSSMVNALGKDATLDALTRELDDSFTAFAVGSTNGVLHFPDTRSCRVSGLTTVETVSEGDSLDEMYTKISSGLLSGVEDLVVAATALNAEMQAAVASQLVGEPVSIEDVQILGDSVVTVDSEGRGAPAPQTTPWNFTALTAGLRMLWPAATPPNATVARFRASTRCYSMLELRTLNETTRCVLESRSVRVRRDVFVSEPLRKFFLGLWSFAILLNTLAGGVVVKYLRKLERAWDATKFERLEPHVARQLGLQATGVLKISQGLLLLAASVPALLSLHASSDPVFLPFFEDERPSKIATDILVTLSMTWFWKVGFETANDWLAPLRSHRQHDTPVDWGRAFTLKWLSMLLVLVIRLATRDGGSDGRFHMRKLVGTCLGSLALGVVSSAVLVWTPAAQRRTKVVADDASKTDHDAVIAALVQQQLPLHRYGVLGRTAEGGWSKAALIVEGWRLARRAADGREVLRKGAGEILLPKDELRSASDDGDMPTSCDFGPSAPTDDDDDHDTEVEVFRAPSANSPAKALAGERSTAPEQL